MNLKLTRELLATADEQPLHAPFRVTGHDATREVELLAAAGFVEGSIDYASGCPTAVISRVTDAGRKLLRILSSQTSPEVGGPIPFAAPESSA